MDSTQNINKWLISLTSERFLPRLIVKRSITFKMPWNVKLTQTRKEKLTAAQMMEKYCWVYVIERPSFWTCIRVFELDRVFHFFLQRILRTRQFYISIVILLSMKTNWSLSIFGSSKILLLLLNNIKAPLSDISFRH